MKKFLILIFFFGILSEAKGQATLYILNNSAFTLTFVAGAADDCFGTSASSDGPVTFAPGSSVTLSTATGSSIIGVNIAGFGTFCSPCLMCCISPGAPFALTWSGTCAATRVVIS